MDTIFTLGDNDDEQTKVNLDDLYERKQQHDLNTLSTYNKVFRRHGVFSVKYTMYGYFYDT